MLRSALHPSRTVLSVDPAPLARRVSSLPGVAHLNADLRSEEAANEMAALSPLSAVVCDSSTDSKVVLPMVREALERAAMTMTMAKSGDEDGEGSEGGKRKRGEDSSATPPSLHRIRRRTPPPLLGLPCLFVLTLKFPHKTGGSVKRNLDRTLEPVVEEVRRIAALASAYPSPAPSSNEAISSSDDAVVVFPRGPGCRARYRVVHLMANSDSERTLLVALDRE